MNQPDYFQIACDITRVYAEGLRQGGAMSHSGSQPAVGQKHDCPQCGQDLRLPVEAYALFIALQKQLRTVDDILQRMLAKEWRETPSRGTVSVRS